MSGLFVYADAAVSFNQGHINPTHPNHHSSESTSSVTLNNQYAVTAFGGQPVHLSYDENAVWVSIDLLPNIPATETTADDTNSSGTVSRSIEALPEKVSVDGVAVGQLASRSSGKIDKSLDKASSKKSMQATKESFFDWQKTNSYADQRTIIPEKVFYPENPTLIQEKKQSEQFDKTSVTQTGKSNKLKVVASQPATVTRSSAPEKSSITVDKSHTLTGKTRPEKESWFDQIDEDRHLSNEVLQTFPFKSNVISQMNAASTYRDEKQRAPISKVTPEPEVEPTPPVVEEPAKPEVTPEPEAEPTSPVVEEPVKPEVTPEPEVEPTPAVLKEDLFKFDKQLIESPKIEEPLDNLILTNQNNQVVATSLQHLQYGWIAKLLPHYSLNNTVTIESMRYGDLVYVKKKQHFVNRLIDLGKKPRRLNQTYVMKPALSQIVGWGYHPDYLSLDKMDNVRQWVDILVYDEKVAEQPISPEVMELIKQANLMRELMAFLRSSLKDGEQSDNLGQMYGFVVSNAFRYLKDKETEQK
ncbi:hypothetical protein [Basilea psittacipulmonis]|uniref:hypothetical protein n=1 Tax=Basilea psittacipulmonis TaxID=1472345 RepID=UPI00068A73D1|nr:hypothetical protein [Basilea psittacipulmonis]